HSLRLALEREAAAAAHEEAATLRRSQELPRSFLSRLSHELRTPLTAIRGDATSLLPTHLTRDAASATRAVGGISAESARLGRLVGDLLDFSAIESGILRLQHDWCDIALVLEAAIACLPPPDAAMVEVTCHHTLPAVWADHDRLEQVFVNLLDNAIRHNPPGTRVFVTAEPGRGGQVVIGVRGGGPGGPGGGAVRVAPARALGQRRGGPGPVDRPWGRGGARRPDPAGSAGEGVQFRDPAAGRGARPGRRCRGDERAGRP